jgi:hypothetical protein
MVMDVGVMWAQEARSENSSKNIIIKAAFFVSFLLRQI